jgi:lipopolysaccharide exporter
LFVVLTSEMLLDRKISLLKALAQEVGQSLIGAADRARRSVRPFSGFVKAVKPSIDMWSQVRALAFREPSIIIATMVALNVVRLASTLIFTRLLAPADFGIVGILGVAQYTVIMLLDLGTDTFIIRHPEIKERQQLNVVWTLRFVRMCVAAAVIALSAGAVARFFDNESLRLPLIVSALGLVAAAPQSLSITLATREKKLVLLSSIDIFLAVFNLALTIALALLFRNYWALIIGSIIGTSVRSLLSYLLFPSPLYWFSFEKRFAGEMWEFSRYVAGSSAITLFLSQIDKFILGRFLPIQDFGIYTIAANLAFMPQTFCGMYGSRVLFPTYSNAYRNDPGSVRQIFHDKLRRVGPLYCFGVGGLIGFAPVIISLMYQDRYSLAAYYFQLLSIPCFFALSCLAATEALVAIGQVRTTYYANLVRLFWLIPAISLAVYSGRTTAILIAIALTEIPATIYTWCKLRCAGVLSIRREAPSFLIGMLGLAAGVGAHKIASLYFHISAIGLLG